MSEIQPGIPHTEKDIPFDQQYEALRSIAHRHLLRIRPGDTLDTTALVHEAYLKLHARSGSAWSDEVHFFATASRVMRHILVDYARKKKSLKRGGDKKREHLDMEVLPTMMVDSSAIDILDLDQALGQLFALNERLARVVEMRFFGGMSIEETAIALSVNARTIDRDLFKAKAFLFRALFSEGLREEK